MKPLETTLSFNTHKGLFEYSRLVYDLSSRPGSFQKLMTNFFRKIKDVVFYDDILIEEKLPDPHLKSIELVFNILEKNGLKIKKERCDFSDQIKYLGFIIDKKRSLGKPKTVGTYFGYASPD